MRYKITCPQCQNMHGVELTDRQRHETDFDVSLEYARTKSINPELQIQIAIAQYEQKCLDHRTNKINENQVALEATRQANKTRNMRAMRGQ